MDANSLISMAENQGIEFVLNGSEVQVFGPREAIKNLKPVFVGNKPKIVAVLAARKASIPLERIELTDQDNERIQWLARLMAAIETANEKDEDHTTHAGAVRAGGHATPRRWDRKTDTMHDAKPKPWWPIVATTKRLVNILGNGTADQKRAAILDLAAFYEAYTLAASWRCDDYDQQGWPYYSQI